MQRIVVVVCYIKNAFKYHYRGYSDTLLANSFECVFFLVFIINYALGIVCIAYISGHVLLHIFVCFVYTFAKMWLDEISFICLAFFYWFCWIFHIAWVWVHNTVQGECVWDHFQINTICIRTDTQHRKWNAIKSGIKSTILCACVCMQRMIISGKYFFLSFKFRICFATIWCWYAFDIVAHFYNSSCSFTK